MKPSTHLCDTYFDETETLYGSVEDLLYENKRWNFTHSLSGSYIGNIGYRAVYMAARELGMSVEDATTFCGSKWIRHNEEYLESIFAQAIITYFGDTDGFANMMNYTED